jgi:urease accessory protein
VRTNESHPIPDEWLIWQLADSAFPSGGFAHSGGLEAAWQHGVVSDSASLARWLNASMQQIIRGILPLVERAGSDQAAMVEIDRGCDLFLNNHVANRASRAQGRAFVATAAGVFDRESLGQLLQSVRSQQTPGHFPVVFGAVCRQIGIEPNRAARLFAFMFLRSQISVAVRLGIIGPLEGQRLQAQWAGASHETIEGIADPAPVQISPVMDLIQGTQDRLYSRLFQS